MGYGYSIGKGEAESSNLSGSTTQLAGTKAKYVMPSKRPKLPKVQNHARTRADGGHIPDTAPKQPRTPHGVKIAELVISGYRDNGFNVGLRCAMFCGWLFCDDGAIPRREAAIEAIMKAGRPEAMLPRLRKIYPEKAGVFDAEWAGFMECVGRVMTSFRLVPDAWIIRPSASGLMTTAVEVVHTHRVSEDKRESYEGMRFYGFDLSDFEVEIIAA